MSEKTASPRRALLLLSAVALAFASFPSVAGASPLVNEPFTYPDGSSLAGQGTPAWQTHSGTAGQLKVNGGRAIVVETAATEDVNKPFTAQATNAKTYASFTMTVTDTTSLATAGYFAHFKKTANTLDFRARVHVARDSVTAGRYKIGIAASSVAANDTASIIYFPGSYTVGSTHMVVSSYNAANGECEMWVDPVNESSTKVTRKRADAAGDAVAEYALRQGAGPTLTIAVDDLFVGPWFGKVTNAPVPSLSQWGIIFLSGLLLLTGAIYTVRRRKTFA